MSAIDWAVVAGGIVGSGAVLWYFFGAERAPGAPTTPVDRSLEGRP